MSQPDKEGLTDRANISNFRQLFFYITSPVLLYDHESIHVNRNASYSTGFE